MELVKIEGRRVAAYSWTTGLVAREPQGSLLEEARRNFDAVFNRLFKEGRDDEAEELFWILVRE